MPIHPSMKPLYSTARAGISLRIRLDRAKGMSAWCGAKHGWPHPQTGSKVILTTAHLDHDPASNAEDNLAALCQKCHDSYDAGRRHATCKRRAHELADQLTLF